MFFDPAKTGLVMLGASQFPNINGHSKGDLDKKVFARANDVVADYFRSSSKGLGLINRNIFHGFDRPGSKESILLQLDRFLSERHFSDVFVYICTHGYADGRYLRLLFRDSTGFDEETSVNFERLYDRINDAALCRVYFIIDCCASGVVHNNSDAISISPEAASYLSSAETLLLPKRGSTILTANSPGQVGKVLSHDNLPGIDLPIFTHALMDLLLGGSIKRSGFGLSMGQVAEELVERIPAILADASARMVAKGESPLEDTHGTMVPYLSDRPRLEGRDGNVISRIGVFPNNIPQQELISRVARSIRINYRRVSEQWEEINRLTEIVAPLNSKIEALEIELASRTGEKAELAKQVSAKDLQITELTARLSSLDAHKNSLVASNKRAFVGLLLILFAVASFLWAVASGILQIV